MLIDTKKSIVLMQGIFKDSLGDLVGNKKNKKVFVLEGRPGLEAAQITCKSLLKAGITPTLITDSMAGFLFYRGLVSEVRLAYQLSDKGGALCDIGALILAVLGKRHRVPVNLFPAKRTTKLFGKQKDILTFRKRPIAPAGIKGFVPLLEWVPKKYITKVSK